MVSRYKGLVDGVLKIGQVEGLTALWSGTKAQILTSYLCLKNQIEVIVSREKKYFSLPFVHLAFATCCNTQNNIYINDIFGKFVKHNLNTKQTYV